MKKSIFLHGILWSFASAFLWGTTYIAGRGLMRENTIDPVSMSIIRFAGAGSIMFLAGLHLYGRKMFDFSRGDFIRMVLQGTIGMAGMSVFIFWGQRSTSAVNSSMIMTAVPVMTMLGGLLIGESIRRIQYLGMGIATVGCFMVIKVIEPNQLNLAAFSRGDLLVFCSAICWTVYTLWGRRTVQKIGGFIYTTYVMLGALPVLLLLEYFNRGNIQLPHSTGAWAVVVYVVFFPTAGAFFAWNQAQKLINLSLLNIMQYLTPVTVLALAWPILGESITLFQLGGALLVILGVSIDPALIDRLRRKKNAVAE